MESGLVYSKTRYVIDVKSGSVSDYSPSTCLLLHRRYSTNTFGKKTEKGESLLRLLYLSSLGVFADQYLVVWIIQPGSNYTSVCNNCHKSCWLLLFQCFATVATKAVCSNYANVLQPLPQKLLVPILRVLATIATKAVGSNYAGVCNNCHKSFSLFTLSVWPQCIL